ncbi:MAG: TetR/AcrR family transcriptional regulator [Deltaproteobacteria bacterium]|nr:MAG: TetR/AcrR family transcriptional regulator [Deltaproteobacteria bacterium]
MADTTRRTKGVQRGQRSQRVVESVRRATLSELARVGYAQLTMDGVATEAGVHRTTLYRRWPTKQDLVASLLDDGLDRFTHVPATDDLRADLLALARQLATDLFDPVGRALAAVLASPAPELREVVDHGRTVVKQTFEDRFARAIATGALPANTDIAARAHLLFFGVVHLALDEVPPGDPRYARLVAQLA